MSERFWMQLQEQIVKRKDKDTFRQLQQYPEGVDFFSNDYLGVARNEPMRQSIMEQVLNSGIPLGSTGSRLISGNSHFIEEAEAAFADFFKSESALLYGSGYHANVGLLQAIGLKDHYFLLDEQAHASIKEGARLSLAKKYTFRHNDTDHLEHRLASLPKGKCIIVTEGIFSMDGDVPPLAEICAIKSKYDALLVLDEAHSTGVLGQNGRGYAEQLKLLNQVDIRVHTFGKAWGHAGAVVVGSNLLKTYLVNASIPFIYTTAPTPIQVFILYQILKYFEQGLMAQQNLSSIIQYWNKFAFQSQYLMRSTNALSPVQYIKTTKDVKIAAKALIHAGFQVKAILPPTVLPGTERVRINLHAYNEKAEIDALFRCLTEMT